VGGVVRRLADGVELAFSGGLGGGDDDEATGLADDDVDFGFWGGWVHEGGRITRLRKGGEEEEE